MSIQVMGMHLKARLNCAGRRMNITAIDY